MENVSKAEITVLENCLSIFHTNIYCEQEVGIQANAEFRNYMRTTASERPMFGKIQRTLKVAQPNRQQAVVANVNPYDVKFHRGGPPMTVKTDPTLNAFQDDMSGAIKSYLRGESNQNDFRAKLMESEVKIDDKIEAMIRKQECGDNVSYHTIGTHVFRQLNGTETYNRPDKPNMNNANIVGPEKCGSSYTSEVPKAKSKASDNLQMEEESRHVTGAYVPRKGGQKANNDAFRSNLFNVLDNDRARQSGASNEY